MPLRFEDLFLEISTRIQGVYWSAATGSPASSLKTASCVALRLAVPVMVRVVSGPVAAANITSLTTEYTATIRSKPRV